jgi:hypothetical protein
MDDDIFRMANYPITVQQRYRKRDGAPEASPPVPDLGEVSFLPEGKVEFFDVDHPSSGFRLTTAHFRQIYDPAK